MNITKRINKEFLTYFHEYDSHGDYNCWGFEAIMNLCKEYTDVVEYNNKMPKGFDSWLYYAPSDYRMVLIDFSYVDDNKIRLLDGTYFNTKDREIITELTIDRFLDIYGMKIIRSVGHWKVKWLKFDIGWDN